MNIIVKESIGFLKGKKNVSQNMILDFEFILWPLKARHFGQETEVMLID